MRRGRAAAVLLTVLPLAACGAPGFDDASASLAATQAEATGLALGVADALRAAGLDVGALHGERFGCSLAPRSGVAYAISGTVAGSDPVSTRLAIVTAALRSAGWTVGSARLDPRRPTVTLTRDGARLTLSRTPRAGRSELVYLTRSRCVRFPDDHVPDLSVVDTVPVPP